MTRFAAYSLIELTIAITIVGLVSAISLPNISTLLRTNELENDASAMADCINRAQRHASAPTTSDGLIRYAAASLTAGLYGADAGALSCTTTGMSGGYTRAELRGVNSPAIFTGCVLPTGGAGTTTTLEQIAEIRSQTCLERKAYVQKKALVLSRIITSNGLGMNNPNKVEVYFDAQRMGAPWLVRACANENTTSCLGTPEPNPDVTTYMSLTRGRDVFYLTVPSTGGLVTVSTVAPPGW